MSRMHHKSRRLERWAVTTGQSEGALKGRPRGGLLQSETKGRNDPELGEFADEAPDCRFAGWQEQKPQARSRSDASELFRASRIARRGQRDE